MGSGQLRPVEEGRTRKRIVLLAVAGAVLFVLGVWVGRGSISVDDATPKNLPRTHEGNSSSLAQRNEEGAIAAATSFARVMPGPSGDEDEYRSQMDELAAAEWRGRARELADNAIKFVNERYGAEGRVVFYPIRYRLAAYSGEEATVRIWGVVLGWGPKLAGVEQSWITGVLRVVWTDDQWKVRGQSSTGGPTPEGLQTDGGAAAPSEIEDFNEYERPPRP